VQPADVDEGRERDPQDVGVDVQQLVRLLRELQGLQRLARLVIGPLHTDAELRGLFGRPALVQDLQTTEVVPPADGGASRAHTTDEYATRNFAHCYLLFESDMM